MSMERAIPTVFDFPLNLMLLKESIVSKIKSVVLVGQKSVICYIQMVVVALLSLDLVESVDLVSVDLVVNCTL